MTNFIFNILDQAPIIERQSPHAAISETVALAQYAETLGYHRYWVAEHHNTDSFAIAAPEILIAHLAAVTSKIHIGSGGVMLPHYSPLKVAEQFQMLTALAPNRIDLGVGRAPGGEPQTAAALQAGPQAWPVEVFPQQVELLQQFLHDDLPPEHPYGKIKAQPRHPNPPPIWMLGSGGDGAIHAAQFGLPYVFAHFINADATSHAISSYQKLFTPSAHLPEPKIAFALSLLAADTEEEAEHLALPRNIWAAKLLQNQPIRFPTQTEAEAYQLTPQDQTVLDQIKNRSFTGTPEHLCEQLADLQKQYHIDEFFLLTITADAQARRESYKLMADAARLKEPHQPVAPPTRRHIASQYCREGKREEQDG